MEVINVAVSKADSKRILMRRFSSDSRSLDDRLLILTREGDADAGEYVPVFGDGGADGVAEEDADGDHELHERAEGAPQRRLARLRDVDRRRQRERASAGA